MDTENLRKTKSFCLLDLLSFEFNAYFERNVYIPTGDHVTHVFKLRFILREGVKNLLLADMSRDLYSRILWTVD